MTPVITRQTAAKTKRPAYGRANPSRRFKWATSLLSRKIPNQWSSIISIYLVSFSEEIIIEAVEIGVPGFHAEFKTADRIVCIGAKLNLTCEQFCDFLDMFSFQGEVRSEILNVGLRE